MSTYFKCYMYAIENMKHRRHETLNLRRRTEVNLFHVPFLKTRQDNSRVQSVRKEFAPRRRNKQAFSSHRQKSERRLFLLFQAQLVKQSFSRFSFVLFSPTFLFIDINLRYRRQTLNPLTVLNLGSAYQLSTTVPPSFIFKLYKFCARLHYSKLNSLANLGKKSAIMVEFP